MINNCYLSDGLLRRHNTKRINDTIFSFVHRRFSISFQFHNVVLWFIQAIHYHKRVRKCRVWPSVGMKMRNRTWMSNTMGLHSWGRNLALGINDFYKSTKSLINIQWPSVNCLVWWQEWMCLSLLAEVLTIFQF